MTRSAKNWCFTVNNYTDVEVQQLAQAATELLESESVLYVVYGKEVGDQGTPHLQGYASFPKRITMHQLKQQLKLRAHCEPAKGTPVQASSYCKKDGDYTEFGQLPHGPGARNDLQQLVERIRNGATKKAIEEEFPGHFIRYRNSILSAIADHSEERMWEVDVRVLWGRTGTGKTRKVFDAHERETIYVHPGEAWFNGYEGQEVALFDDFNGSEFKLAYFLKILDRYPMRVPIKGAYVQWKPKIIYITSNKDPADWYRNALPEHRDAMFRRIKTIEYFP